MSKEQVAKVLWDIAPENQANLPINFLIKRVLVYGGFFLIRDMFKEYDKEKITEVFNSLKTTEVGEKKHYFFKKYLFS